MTRKKDVNASDKNTWLTLAVKLRGYQTIDTIVKALKVKKKTAINYIYEMKKRGFIHTTRGRSKIRMYDISPVKRKIIGYPGIYDIINKYSTLKIAKPYEHRVYKPMTVEEAIVRAIKMQDFRLVLAALELFHYVKNWKKLLELAHDSKIEHQVGALYDISRCAHKARKIPQKIEAALLKAQIKEKYIIHGISVEDFSEIKKKWGVFIPFRISDIMRLKQ